MERTDGGKGEFWADKLMDLANLSSTVLVFSQLVGPTMSWEIVVLGVLVYASIVLIVSILRRR